MKNKKMIIGFAVLAVIAYVMYRKGVFGKKTDSVDQSTTKDIAPLKAVQDYVPSELTGTEPMSSAGGNTAGCRSVGLTNPSVCEKKCTQAGGTFIASGDYGNGTCANFTGTFGQPLNRRARTVRF